MESFSKARIYIDVHTMPHSSSSVSSVEANLLNGPSTSTTCCRTKVMHPLTQSVMLFCYARTLQGLVHGHTAQALSQLSATVGGGKPKMRWYFGQEGWPENSITEGVPESEADQTVLIDTLQVRAALLYSLAGNGSMFYLLYWSTLHHVEALCPA